MGNAAIMYANLADAGAVTASSQAQTLPASNLLTPHVSERWRSLGNQDYFVLDTGALSTADTILVRGMTATATASARLRLSSSDSTGAAGDVLDTGFIVNQASANFDLNYGAFVYLLTNPASWRYLRFDIKDLAASYVEAGIVAAGTRTVFDYNWVPGASLGYVDRSPSAQTVGGQTQIWQDNTYRQLSLNFDFVDSTQRYGLIETMDRVNGQHSSLLAITDVGSSNLARDSIWGLISTLSPVTSPDVIDIFGKQITINERL